MSTYTIKTSGAFIETCNVAPTHSGSLNNLTFAVKDVIDLKNFTTSFGNPLWQQTQPKAKSNAVCVDQLLGAGARCLGKTIISEFARGLTGVNHFYGMPINPAAPDRVPGGSSSGSASAVACGLVDFALGTDTGGSVRLPASYCGLFGMRPSTGAISLDGVHCLSKSFDTVGVFSKTKKILNKVMEVLISAEIPSTAEIGTVYLLEDLFNAADIKIQSALKNSVHKMTSIAVTDIDPMANDCNLGWSNTYKTIVSREIWDEFGEWVSQHHLEFGKTTFVDFISISNIPNEIYISACEQMSLQHKLLNKFLLPNNLICIPTVPEITPNRNDCITETYKTNYTLLRPSICISCIGGLPQITLPLGEIDNIPVGLSLLAAHGQDMFLLKACEQLFDGLLK